MTLPRTSHNPAPARRRSDADIAALDHLVPATAAGDRRAFAELVTRYRPLVAAVARRHVSRQADVDDVVQDVWIALWQHVGAIERPRALPGWLRRVTVHAALRAQARSGRLVAIGEVDDLVSDEQTEELGVARSGRAELHQAVQGALGRLRTGDRRLVELLMADDRPDYRSVSRAIDRPVGSIGPTRQRVFDRLRRDPELERVAPLVAA
jgi:RNA polymerase sigma factor (sigma-70 family)